MADKIKYLIAGLFFGILLTKAEVISWFRMQEMFRFQSFHMYGIISSAIAVGMISLFIIRKFKIKSLDGEEIKLEGKKFNKGFIIGGFLFGIGWAFTGACPGPIYAQIGAGFTVSIIMLLAALLGTFTYGYFKEKLPH
jgi:uncharacterized protein